MIKSLIKRIALGVIVICLLLGAASCGRLKTTIPQHIVSEAVAQQAQQAQNSLWQQLSPNQGTAPTLSVKKVKVRQVRSVRVSSDLAYEVTGTYQYKLRYPNRPAVNQSQVPFNLILHHDSELQSWQLLQWGESFKRDRTWRWQPLTGDRA